MLLEFENIAKIKKAAIELTDLTVITGVNNSGKSTVGKLIYVLATGITLYQSNYLFVLKYTLIMEELENLERWVDNETFPAVNALRRELQTALYRMQRKAKELEQREVFSEDAYLAEKIDKLLNLLQKKMATYLKWSNRPQLAAIIKSIQQQQRRDFLDQKVTAALFDRLLRQEFSNYLISEASFAKSAVISLKEENDDQLLLHYKNNRLDDFQCLFQLSKPYQEAICLDDAFLLENLSSSIEEKTFGAAPSEKLQHISEAPHRRRLLEQIKHRKPEEKYLRDKRIKAIFSEVLAGGLMFKQSGYYFFQKNVSKGIPFNALSSGMKTFAVLQLIIENGLVADSDYLILEEPEIHLHPHWQVKLAELLVCLSTTYSTKVLVTSHSPYFIEALSIYSAKQKQPTGIKFYNAQLDKKDPETSKIVDVTDHLETIYAEMYQPLIHLEELRAELE